MFSTKLLSGSHSHPIHINKFHLFFFGVAVIASSLNSTQLIPCILSWISNSNRKSTEESKTQIICSLIPLITPNLSIWSMNFRLVNPSIELISTKYTAYRSIFIIRFNMCACKHRMKTYKSHDTYSRAVYRKKSMHHTHMHIKNNRIVWSV